MMNLKQKNIWMWLLLAFIALVATSFILWFINLEEAASFEETRNNPVVNKNDKNVVDSSVTGDVLIKEQAEQRAQVLADTAATQAGKVILTEEQIDQEKRDEEEYPEIAEPDNDIPAPEPDPADTDGISGDNQ